VQNTRIATADQIANRKRWPWMTFNVISPIAKLY